jgi:integrase
VDGKIVRISTNTDSKTTAKLRLGDIKTEERKKLERANPSLTDVKTFGDALTVLERRINNAVKLRSGARRDNFDNIRRIKATWPGIEKMLLRDLNTDGILDWAKPLHEKYSATSYNNTLGMFRRVIAVGIEAGAIARDPTIGGDGKRLVERVAPPLKQLVLPNDEQWQSILTEADRNVGYGGRGAGWLIRFLAYTGARLQEARGYSEHEIRRLAEYGGVDPQQATGVRKRDVDLARNMIRLYGKGGKERWIPLLAEARELIEEIFAARPNMKDDDRLMTVMECPETLIRCCNKAGCQKLTHHDLRHFFATRLIEMGIDIPTVAKLLGHADGGALAMKVYGHLRMAYLQKRLQNLRFNTNAMQPQAMLPSSDVKSHIEASEMMSELRTLLEKVLAEQSASHQPVIDLKPTTVKAKALPK